MENKVKYQYDSNYPGILLIYSTKVKKKTVTLVKCIHRTTEKVHIEIPFKNRHLNDPGNADTKFDHGSFYHKIYE